MKFRGSHKIKTNQEKHIQHKGYTMLTSSDISRKNKLTTQQQQVQRPVDFFRKNSVESKNTSSSISSLSSSNSIVDLKGDLLPDLWQTSSNESYFSDTYETLKLNALNFSQPQQPQPQPQQQQQPQQEKEQPLYNPLDLHSQSQSPCQITINQPTIDSHLYLDTIIPSSTSSPHHPRLDFQSNNNLQSELLPCVQPPQPPQLVPQTLTSAQEQQHQQNQQRYQQQYQYQYQQFQHDLNNRDTSNGNINANYTFQRATSPSLWNSPTSALLLAQDEISWNPLHQQQQQQQQKFTYEGLLASPPLLLSPQYDVGIGSGIGSGIATGLGSATYNSHQTSNRSIRNSGLKSPNFIDEQLYNQQMYLLDEDVQSLGSSLEGLHFAKQLQQQSQQSQHPLSPQISQFDVQEFNGTFNHNYIHKSEIQQNQQQQQPPQQPPQQLPQSPPALAPAPVQQTPYQTAKVNTQLYKTELCAPFMKTGVCTYGTKCQFAHGEQELKHVERPPKWRSKPCTNWAKYGSCRYGNRCCFKHGD